MKLLRGVFSFRLLAALCILASGSAFAQSGSPCPRYAAGSTIVEPEDLYSSNGVLTLSLAYQTRIDPYGNTLYCYTSSDGAQGPTLHVFPGDQLIINFTNGLPATTSSDSMHSHAGMVMTGSPSSTCGAVVMNNA